MSHCKQCHKLKRRFCRYCEPQEYIDMLHRAMMDMQEEFFPKRKWVDLTEEDYVIINSLCERKLEAAEYAAHLLKEKNCE